MELNIDKFMFMEIIKNSLQSTYTYKINNFPSIVHNKKDLGVWFDSRWTFNIQIDQAVSKAHRLTGFIKRTTFKFQ